MLYYEDGNEAADPFAEVRAFCARVLAERAAQEKLKQTEFERRALHKGEAEKRGRFLRKAALAGAIVLVAIVCIAGLVHFINQVVGRTRRAKARDDQAAAAKHAASLAALQSYQEKWRPGRNTPHLLPLHRLRPHRRRRPHGQTRLQPRRKRTIRSDPAVSSPRG